MRDSGNDSISEFARTAMKLLAQNDDGNGKAAIESRFDAMGARISELETEIGRLSTLMATAGSESNNDQH